MSQPSFNTAQTSSNPTLTARYANAEVTRTESEPASFVREPTPGVLSRSSSEGTSTNVIPMQAYTPAPPAPPPPVAPMAAAAAVPPSAAATAAAVAASPQLKYDDPVQRRRIRRCYLLSGIFLLLNAIVLAAVGGAVDSPSYRIATAFGSYNPGTRRFRFTDLDYRGNMLIVPYICIFVGIMGIGFILTGIFARRVQRILAADRQNYWRGITVILATTWLTFLLAFAINVTEIFLLLALAGLTTAMFGFWMLMDTVNRPGVRFNFWAHVLGWICWAYIFTALFAYAWADVNREMPAILYVALFFLLGYYTLIGLMQFMQYLSVGYFVNPYRLDMSYLVVHVIFILVIAWLLFATFIGLENVDDS